MISESKVEFVPYLKITGPTMNDWQCVLMPSDWEQKKWLEIHLGKYPAQVESGHDNYEIFVQRKMNINCLEYAVLARLEGLIVWDYYLSPVMIRPLDFNKVTNFSKEMIAKIKVHFCPYAELTQAQIITGNLKPDKVLFPPEPIVSQRLKETVNQVLQVLTEQEEKALRLRFGVGDEASEHTLEEVGSEFSVTRERIRQIEEKALRKIRHPRYEKTLKAFLG